MPLCGKMWTKLDNDHCVVISVVNVVYHACLNVWQRLAGPVDQFPCIFLPKVMRRIAAPWMVGAKAFNLVVLMRNKALELMQMKC